MTRQRQNWDPKGEDQTLVDAVDQLLHSGDYRAFWPLTLRQIYYGLVGALVIENVPKEYKRLGGIVVKGRLAGLLPWAAVKDNHREMHEAGGWDDADTFIQYHREDFLEGYTRKLAATQPIAFEVWIEKDALADVVKPVAHEFNLPIVVAKGYSSVSYVNELRDRVEEEASHDRPTKILYFGDLDPSGWNMLPMMFVTLHEEMGVDEETCTYERCALNRDQVDKYRLPQSPDALKDDEWQARQRALGRTNKKKGDPRAEAYKAEFGNLAVELDAFKPRQLQAVVREAILRNIDVDAFEIEKDQQEADLERIAKLRAKVEKALKGVK